MACIYKYKGKKYTKEQFHNLVSKQLMGIPVHIEEQEEAKASPQTIKEVREFLKRLDVESIMDISIGGRKLSPADVVNLLYQAQSMVQGEVPDYFSADSMYFITELIERLNPKLFNKLFKEIHKYGIYEEVFSEDKYQDAYREKNGSVNVRAIKKDAIAKLLEQVFILKNNEIEENHSLIQYLSNWWETVKSFLEKAFQKPGFTLFDETDLVIEEEAPPIEIDEYINLNEPTTTQNVPLSQPTGTQLDVEKLFNENPELANSVYEALGFKSRPDVILPIGTSGSGKSTFVKSLPQENLVIIEPDAMRVEFTGDMNNKSKDKEIYIEAANRAIKAIKQGKQVVFDTTNLTKEKRLPFIEAIKKEIPTANIQYKLMELNPELAKQRIKAQLERGENRANVPDSTIDRHAESYKQMLEDIKNEPISNYEVTPQQKQQAQQLYAQYLSQNPNGSVEGFKSWLDNNQSDVQYQLPQGREIEEFVASEKTIRDLAARMSDRIGIPVKFESDRTKKYKGKLETKPGFNHTTKEFDNITYAVINLAYATLDTPIHEILGHPIIRAIKGDNILRIGDNVVYNSTVFGQITSKIIDKKGDTYILEDGSEIFGGELTKKKSNLYQNLLKELEYGKGKEVLDRIKRDYQYKTTYKEETATSFEEERELISRGFTKERINEDGEPVYRKYDEYTLEEQQEEAIVELLGLYTADRLDKVKDGKLISLLKRLLKEMKAFMKQLLGQKEVEIDKLPDNMTLGDIADLLAYSNSKLILPGNEVVYTTPDNRQFKTYAEASKHISDLAKNVEDVDLSNLSIRFATKIEDVPDKFSGYAVTDNISGDGYEVDIFKNSEGKFKQIHPYTGEELDITDEQVLLYYNGLVGIKSFIEKNKQYEQSKEIIEEWKKVNNIQYNPEEVYSRGQEFVSVVGAYSDFDVNLMMQNLLQHIEDNQKAGGEFIISAFTKPVDRKIGHLEGGGGKIKFKIYPQSKDIKWAANTDVFSGSVWDASEKVSKDKKSELLGVSYTKYPSLRNVNAVQPNLAAIIDNLAHYHNELGITLTGSNFRLEYDEDVPYSTKKIINNINSILDQKYGKLVKPEIKETKNYEGLNVSYKGDNSFKIVKSYESDIFRLYDISNGKETITGLKANEFDFIDEVTKGIRPTQTHETLKESIWSVKNKVVPPNLYGLAEVDITYLQFQSKINPDIYASIKDDGTIYFYKIEESTDFGTLDKDIEVIPDKDVKEELIEQINKQKKLQAQYKKEYHEQALINLRIAKFKEVAKKYPRSLIRSEVRPINSSSNLQFSIDELPFQKVSDSSFQQSSNNPNTDSTSQDNQEETKSEVIDDTKGKAIFDKLVEEGKKIVLKDGPKKGDSFYEVLGEKVGRVSDVVKEWYARHFGAGDLTKSEFQTAIDEIKREKGTEGHKDIENIILRYVDKSTGLLRENPLPMPVGIMGAGTDYMNKLDVFVKDMLNSYPSGTRFLVEQKVYNPATKMAGTIDFIAIEPSGKVGFRDWKFTDIKESQEDVPWFKKGAWREQSKEYKKILKAVYGVTSFGQIRTHPFLTQYRFEGEKGQKELKLKGISVPPFDVSAIRDLRMLPVSEKYESTGNKKLDALIDALNTQYEKWQKVRGFDEDRDARNQRNNDLERAIRTLQVQQQVGGLLKTGNSILYATKNHVNALVKQSRQEKLTKKEIRTIAGKLLEAVGTLELFTDLDNIFQEVNLGKEDKEAISKLAKESRDVVNTIKNDVYGEVGEIIANGYGIKHLSAPERVVDYIGRNFKSLSSAETKASQVLWRIVERFTGASRIRYSEAVDRLNTMKRNLEEFAASRGFTVAELVEKLKAKDARGWTGDLISEIDQKFYTELKEKQKEIVNAKEWIKENIDMDSYLEWYKEALANKEKYERSQVYIPENSTENEAEQTRRINKWKDKYDVNGKYFHTLANDALRFHPKKSVWTSKEYQEILNLGDNNPLLQFHTYWVERMKHSKKLGMIHHHAYKTFFPNVSKNALEMAFEGIRNPNKQKHLRIFDSLKEDFANDLIIDPVTKQPIQNITANFVFDLGSRRIDKSTNEEFLDYSQKSDDVFKIMALWEHEIVKFELRTEVESEVKLLSAIEKAKKHLEVDRRTGNLEEVTGNEINSKYFDNFMDAFLYGRRYAEDMKGTMNVNINNTVDKLNGFFKRTLNVEPFPRAEDDNIAISINKVIEWMNKWFQLKTLGLNVPVSLANAVGGKLNSYIKSGKHFSKGDLMKADIMLASSATTGEQGKKVLAMLEYFVPLTDDQKDMLARKLSIKGKVHMANLSSDWLFYLMRGSDKFVQYPVAIAFAMNTMVKDGELINIREYVRGKYEKGMFRLPPSERIALEKKMEAEIEELQKQSILFTGKLVENKFVLEGITRDSETVYKHINKILGFSKDVLGAMEPNDFYQYRMNILTKSAMMFKSWIPRMAKDRFGKLQYDVGKDDWEWGRVNIFFSALLSNLRDSVKMLIGVASGKESLIQRALKLYAIKQAEFGADEFMTEEAFVNMYIAGVQQMMRETLMWLSLAGMVLASAAAVPDDDDDEYKGAYKWVARLFDKFYDELSFFYSPKSAIEIGNGSLFPAMGTLLDIQNFLSKGGQDLFYTVIGDEEKTDKIKTSKYLFKAIPVTKEIMQYLAIFNEEFAKEFGIVITTNNRNR